MIDIPSTGGNAIGLVDVTAGTAWYAVIPGAAGAYTRLASMEIDNGATDNGIYVMRPLTSAAGTGGYAPVTTAATTATADLILDRDPSPAGNTISSGDQVVIEFADGTQRRCQVSSWSASTLTLTLTATLPANVSAGAYLWNFGVYTDAEPRTALAFPKIDTPASAVTTRDKWQIGFAAWDARAPILLYCPNATNKTKLNYAEFARTGG